MESIEKKYVEEILNNTQIWWEKYTLKWKGNTPTNTQISMKRVFKEPTIISYHKFKKEKKKKTLKLLHLGHRNFKGNNLKIS